MAVDVKFTILGVAGFRREILQVNERGQDMSPAFKKLAYKWLNWNVAQFDSEGKTSTRPWAQLKTSTVRRRGSAHPILRVTGGLEDAMTSRSNIHIRDRSMHFFVKEPRENKLAGIHYGGNEPTMPARRPIDFSRNQHREMTEDIRAWLTAGRL